MIRSITVFCILVAFAAGCSENTTDPGPAATGYSFSFEKGMQNWIKNGADLDHGDSTITWSVERTRDGATEGSWSVRLFLDNMNDAGKIWIQREFPLYPNTPYMIKVDYNFASADYGAVNLFTIIAGAASTPPRGSADFTFQGTTDNGAPADVGYTWMNKSHTFSVRTGSDGRAYIFLGVWGTWEAARSYYIDNVRVRFTEIDIIM
jgi:hypothetical protein